MACGAAGAMALFLSNAETICALLGWISSVLLIVALLEPTWVLSWAIILTVNANAEKRRRELAKRAEASGGASSAAKPRKGPTLP